MIGTNNSPRDRVTQEKLKSLFPSMIIINQQLENICLILIWVEELDYELLVKHNHDNSYAHSVTDVHTQKQKLEHFFFASINDMKCIKFTETARQRKRIRLIFFHRMEWFSWCYIQMLNNMTKDRDSQKMILIYMKRGKTGMLRANCHKKSFRRRWVQQLSGSEKWEKNAGSFI